ncbi:MAG TPA: efflux RND transporter permease subunit [Gemmatimonadota bacterium]|nr:efflux RND transporter permease subunit [Gemmatimonadota bacterium]
MTKGPAGRIADLFIGSKLTPLLLAAALGVGLYSTLTMPSEEEPQIIVPVADIFVMDPGREPEEIENRILVPLESALTGIEGVEYVYTHAERGMALATVRFEVGRDMEQSQVRLWSALLKHADRMPPGASPPLIKTVTIDDVPFFTAALFGGGLDGAELRELAEEVRVELEALPDVREVTVIGGRPREIHVELLTDRLAAFGVDPGTLSERLRAADTSIDVGDYARSDEVFRVQAGSFLTSAADVEQVVVDVRDGRLVRVEDVARVVDGPAEVDTYTFHWTREAGFQPMVTLAVAKRPGADATALGRSLEQRLDAMHGRVVPRDAELRVMRNYGETAREKVTTLQEHLFLAIVAVGIVVALSMGWRSAAVVMVAVPVTFALTLLVYRLFGYTLNRVTLFALIFVTGIVIDDSIIVVENMHRHFSMRARPLRDAARVAIDEVGNPTILATLTVIAAVLPMLFVSGLMGPYMSPMPIGATLAMSFSLLVALVIAPWLAFRLLSKHGEPLASRDQGAGSDAESSYVLERTRIYRLYESVMEPLLERPRRLYAMLGGVTLLLLAAVVLFPLRVVTVKMLPFDDKNEMQVIMDLPEGTTLERTAAAARDVARALADVPEVVEAQVYVGTAAPFNFNGLIRHYYLRRGSNVADVQVNLSDKGDRKAQSHDVARRLRPLVQEAAARSGPDVSAKVVEVPPGPPVLSTLVAEVYGESHTEREDVAREIRRLFGAHPGVVDLDWSLAAPQREIHFVIDEEKAALSGVAKATVANALRIALAGDVPASLSEPSRRAPVPVRLRLDEASRSGAERLGALHVASMTGAMVPVGELVRAEEVVVPQVIDRKNGRRVVYVTADVAGEEESPVYAILDLDDRLAEIELPSGARLGQLYARQPGLVEQPVVKWDGEWQITYEVFRDLGIAFAGALILIYVLIVGWFGSLTTPLIIMVAIPLTLVGIVPGHLLFGAFFTATSMIGMIALAGIMVRNGILLVDYIEARLKAGVGMNQAIIEAGAVRTRPIALTAGTVAIGALVILFDPIFQGLAVSLIAGAVASTVLTLVVVPGIYFLVHAGAKNREEGP